MCYLNDTFQTYRPCEPAGPGWPVGAQESWHCCGRLHSGTVARYLTETSGFPCKTACGFSTCMRSYIILLANFKMPPGSWLRQNLRGQTGILQQSSLVWKQSDRRNNSSLQKEENTPVVCFRSLIKQLAGCSTPIPLLSLSGAHSCTAATWALTKLPSLTRHQTASCLQQSTAKPLTSLFTILFITTDSTWLLQVEVCWNHLR